MVQFPKGVNKNIQRRHKHDPTPRAGTYNVHVTTQICTNAHLKHIRRHSNSEQPLPPDMNQHPLRAHPFLQLCSCKWLSWYNIRLSGRKPTDTPGSPAVCHLFSPSQSTVSQRELRTPVLPSAVTKLKEQLQHNDKAYSFVAAFNPHCWDNSGVGVFPQKTFAG